MSSANTSRQARGDVIGRRVRSVEQPSLTKLCHDLPPVVYFMRTRDGLIKIGHTRDLAARKYHFGSGWTHILAIVPGTRDDERAMHQRFADHLARGREYFHPAPEVIDYINALRGQLGVSPVDAAA